MMKRRSLVLISVCSALLAACTSRLDAAPETVLVAGATGKTGRLVVQQLLANGYQVRALVRDEAQARAVLGDGKVELVQGDVKDPASLVAAFKGVDAVISAIGARGKTGPDRPEAVDYEGVRNLATAAAAAGVKQFVLVSSRGVTQKDNPLNRMFGNVLVWKLKGEDALRASGVPYTVVRPGGLTNGPGNQDVTFDQGDRTGNTSTISRADVALVCVEALRFPEARNRTFELGTTAGPPVADWRARFAALKPDPR